MKKIDFFQSSLNKAHQINPYNKTVLCVLAEIEGFLRGYNKAFELLDTDIQDRRTAIKTTKDALILTARYTCVQDIAVKSEIGIEN